MHLLKWGRARLIAGVCSAFILVNSCSGLAGQLMKLNNSSKIGEIVDYWPLFLAVFIGGQIGSISANGWLDPRWIRIMTASLILFVALRLLLRSIHVIA